PGRGCVSRRAPRAAPPGPAAPRELALKGSWQATMHSAIGAVPIAMRFNRLDSGEIDFGGSSVAFAYRQNGVDFSISAEVPATISATSSAFTLLIRGTLSDANTFSALAWFISDQPTADPLPFQVGTGTVDAIRIH